MLILLCALGLDGKEQETEKASVSQKFSWLSGNWKIAKSGDNTHEKWIRISDQIMQGKGYTIENGDTTFSETMRIEQFGNDIFYVVKVAESKYPVPFKLIKLDKNEVTFENSEHDFPQRIIYKLKADGSLHARIEGRTTKGEEQGMDFLFNKIK